MADSPSTNDPLDEAFADYLRSCDAGELSSREEFLAQFPDLADELKQLIEAADMIGQVTLGHSSTTKSGLEAGAETIAAHHSSGDSSGGDPAATLPMPSRSQDDSGPTLPYDLGEYELLEIIGRGGMGVVYLAKQHELDRHVAVKMIRSGIFANEAEVRRFYTEAQAAARLHHSGIVAIHQFGRCAGHHFFFRWSTSVGLTCSAKSTIRFSNPPRQQSTFEMLPTQSIMRIKKACCTVI